MAENTGNRCGKLVKILQVFSFLFMAAMLTVCIVFMANSFALVFIFKAGGLMPSDLSSLIFGAMNIPFGKYFIASNLGMLILNVLWTLLGSKGDLSNPFSYLYALPALVFAVVASVVMNKIKKKKQIQDNKEETETDEEV